MPLKKKIKNINNKMMNHFIKIKITMICVAVLIKMTRSCSVSISFNISIDGSNLSMNNLYL